VPKPGISGVKHEHATYDGPRTRRTLISAAPRRSGYGDVFRSVFSWLTIGFLIAGCAAKPVSPVAMSQPGDETMDCAQLAREIATNRDRAADLLVKQNGVEQGNTAKVVASLLVSGWISLAIDLSREEQIVMRSLGDRNDRLIRLTKQKGCAAT
jgi:hypothetical protein